jgi:hypothetical protein
MDNEPTSIWNEKYRIEKARREKLKEAMDEYDRDIYYPSKKELYARCEKETGHNWTFTGTNPIGCPIFNCSTCGGCKIDCSHLDKDEDND